MVAGVNCQAAHQIIERIARRAAVLPRSKAQARAVERQIRRLDLPFQSHLGAEGRACQRRQPHLGRADRLAAEGHRCAVVRAALLREDGQPAGCVAVVNAPGLRRSRRCCIGARRRRCRRIRRRSHRPRGRPRDRNVHSPDCPRPSSLHWSGSGRSQAGGGSREIYERRTLGALGVGVAIRADDNFVVAVAVHISGRPDRSAEVAVPDVALCRPISVNRRAGVSQTGRGAMIHKSASLIDLARIVVRCADDDIVVAVAVYITR